MDKQIAAEREELQALRAVLRSLAGTLAALSGSYFPDLTGDEYAKGYNAGFRAAIEQIRWDLDLQCQLRKVQRPTPSARPADEQLKLGI